MFETLIFLLGIINLALMYTHILIYFTISAVTQTLAVIPCGGPIAGSTTGPRTGYQYKLTNQQSYDATINECDGLGMDMFEVNNEDEYQDAKDMFSGDGNHSFELSDDILSYYNFFPVVYFALYNSMALQCDPCTGVGPFYWGNSPTSEQVSVAAYDIFGSDTFKADSSDDCFKFTINERKVEPNTCTDSLKSLCMCSSPGKSNSKFIYYNCTQFFQ